VIALYQNYMVDLTRVGRKEPMMKKQESGIKTIKHWREKLTLQGEKRLYLESIPRQVSASMALEGERVNLKMLTKYLRTLKDTAEPLAS